MLKSLLKVPNWSVEENVLHAYLFENLHGVQVQRRITSSMNIDGEEDMCDEESVSEEEGGDEGGDDKLNGTVIVEHLEGGIGYNSGNGDCGWETLQKLKLFVLQEKGAGWLLGYNK